MQCTELKYELESKTHYVCLYMTYRITSINFGRRKCINRAVALNTNSHILCKKEVVMLNQPQNLSCGCFDLNHSTIK